MTELTWRGVGVSILASLLAFSPSRGQTPAASGAPAASPLPAANQTPAEPSPAPSPAPAPNGSETVATPAPPASPIEAATTESSTLVVTPEPAPKRIEEVAPLRAKIEERLAKYPALETVENPTPAQVALTKATNEFRDALAATLKQLEAFEQAHQAVAEQGAAEFVAARNTQLEQYRARIDEIKSNRPRTWSQDDLAVEKQAVAREYDKINALTDVTVKQQTARAQALAQFPNREKETAAAAAEARQTLAAYLKTSPAGNGNGEAEMDTASLRLVRELSARALAWRVTLANLRIEQLAVEKVLLTLETAAAETTIPVLQDYARALSDYRAKLDQAVARSELELIEEQLKAAEQVPHREAYWKLRQAIAAGRQEFAAKLDSIRGRFRESDKQALLREINSITGAYEHLQNRLERTTGSEETQAYQRLASLIEQYTRKRDELLTQADLARRELDQLLEQRDTLNDTLRRGQAELRAALENITTPSEREQFDALVVELATTHRSNLEATMAEVIQAEQDVIERLTDADAELNEFHEQLLTYREGLFWAYTTARGPHALGKFRQALADVRDGVVRTDLRAATDRVRQQVRGEALRFWVYWAVVIGLLCGLGWYLRVRFWRAADRMEDQVSSDLQESEATEVHLSDRVRIQGSRMLGMTLPLGLPAAVLLFGVWFGGYVQGATRIGLAELLLCVLAAVVVRALVKRLFKAGKPRFRIIPCSNVVAAYYRFWLSVLWWIVVLLVPAVLLLDVFGVAPGLSAGLWTLHVILALGALLAFMRNRQTVVRVVGRAFAQRRPVLFSFIVRMYPLALLVLLALFGMEIAGYSAFVAYVVRNTLMTLLALMLAGLIAGMLHDFARPAEAPASDAPQDESVEAGPLGLDEMLAQFESREWGLLVSTLATLGQWVVWLGAIAFAAGAWGMTRITAKRVLGYPLVAANADTGRGPVTIGLVLAAIFAIYAAFKLSRVIRHTLNAKVFPAYGHVNIAAQATINSLLHYTLVTLGFYIGLRLIQIELGALVVLLGGLGLGLGLGLQPLVVNFVSGLIIYAERHVKVGDIVAVGEDLGEVKSVSMRSTQIRSFDGIDLIIPNSEFVTTKVTNWTLQDWKIRGKLNVGVAYGSDVHKVRDILLGIAQAEPRVLPDPEPTVWFTDFGESSLNFVLAAWYPTPGDRWFAMIDMRYEIDRQFKEAGIEIPFPQRTLSIDPDMRLPVSLIDERSAGTSARTAAASPDAGPENQTDARVGATGSPDATV
jgi:small-conductance mechanosensitive channel